MNVSLPFHAGGPRVSVDPHGSRHERDQGERPNESPTHWRGRYDVSHHRRRGQGTALRLPREPTGGAGQRGRDTTCRAGPLEPLDGARLVLVPVPWNDALGDIVPLSVV